MLVLNLIMCYLAVGALFAPVFALFGAERVLPREAHVSPGARVLLLPGATLLWPLLVIRWAGALSR